jgi:hypothetical protein
MERRFTYEEMPNLLYGLVLVRLCNSLEIEGVPLVKSIITKLKGTSGGCLSLLFASIVKYLSL